MKSRNPVAKAVKKIRLQVIPDKKRIQEARCYCNRPLDKCDGDHCNGKEDPYAFDVVTD